MEIIVYTSIIGEYDVLWSANKVNSLAKFIAFTSSKKAEKGHWDRTNTLVFRNTYSLPTWEQKILSVVDSNRRTARHVKLVPQQFMAGADIWIWLDGDVRLKVTPEYAIKHWLPQGVDLATFKHPDRLDLYEEAQACVRFKKDNKEVLRLQSQAYKQQGHPKNWGLAETKIIIRRNTPKIRQLNKLWWEELTKYSVRDQISLPYVCWKLGIMWNRIPGICNRSDNFIQLGHIK